MLLNARSPITVAGVGVFLVLAILGFSITTSNFQIDLAHFLPLPQEKFLAESGILIYLNPRDHISRDPRTIRAQWNITKGFRAPDGVNKTVYLINGRFPGPAVEARGGDTLVIEVLNSLPDGEVTAIHWHGLHMRGANHMDGATGITQDAIPSGESFTYNFRIADNEAGTFWYHSHSELQRADGLYGGLVVHEPYNGTANTLSTDEVHDGLILAGDWYHRPAVDIQAGYVNSKSWGLEPAPDSLLLNGHGAFNCSSTVPARPVECAQKQPPSLGMRHGKHRLRVVNVGAMSGISLDAPSLSMLPVSIDGSNRLSQQSSSTSFGVVYPGERVDVMVEPSDSFENGFLSIHLDEENFTFQNKALTPTHHFPLSSSTTKQDSEAIKLVPLSHSNYSNLSEASGIGLSEELPATPNQTILLYTKMEILQHMGNVPMGFINRTSWTPQNDPQKPLIELSREQFDSNQLVPHIANQSRSRSESSNSAPDPPYWVDIVINNLDDKGHPFHLHGYDFYVLQVWKSPLGRYRTYNPYEISKESNLPTPPGGQYNLANPVKKDTIYVPRMGYAVLRIRADNPGIWFLHCHILWHQGTGMAMALQID